MHHAPTSGDTPSAAPLPAHDCPRCGRPNACAVARAGRFDVPCWCRDVRIAPATLQALPPADHGRACLCAGCAAGTTR